MNLITANGLNCYYSCVAGTADYFDIDYRAACGNLWSETKFTYDEKHGIYLTARFIDNLEILGAKLIQLDATSPQKTAESIAAIGPAPDVMLVGMDAFQIPWSSVYHDRHALHYFFGIKADPKHLICFDALYKTKYASLPYEYIAEHAFDIRRVQKSDPQSFAQDIPLEAKSVLAQHPFLLADLTDQIKSLAEKPPKETVKLAKYIEALRDNRFLFQGFLKTQPAYQWTAPLFTSELFFKWTAVKNGLHKIAVTSNHTGISPSVCGLLEELIAEEIHIAEMFVMK